MTESSEMSADVKTAARLKRGAVRKSKPKRGVLHVPPLWATSLGTVIDHLSERHTDEFVQTICSDSKLRGLLTEELLRRAKHGPELGDSDVVEVVLLAISDSHISWDGHRDGSSGVEHILKHWKVGDLPYRLKAALKKQFKTRCAKGAKVSNDWGAGNVQVDGRLEFELSNDGDGESLVPLQDAYIEYLHDLIFEESIPCRDDLPHTACVCDLDEIDIDDVAEGVQPYTCSWDAWDLQVNCAEESLRQDFMDEIEEIFDTGTKYGHQLPDHFATAPGKAHLSTVWIRKPRCRFVLRP